ncbi:MAG: signal recognition particle receptor subunit alpha, partial [Terracidiphilus sp.]
MITLFGKPEPTLLERLKTSVTKTRTELSARVEQLLTGDRPVDPELLKQLETALLSADIGVTTTKQVLAALRQQVNEHKLTEAAALKQELKRQLVNIVAAPATGNGHRPDTSAAAPRVLFVVGVNGTGKTTTIGKLANRLKKEGASVLLCAADTFRAAAIEQLEVWGRRAGVEVVKQKS